ncbi:MAG: hypothetical protein WBL21_05835, partial [Salinimicrobium sp.]
INRKENKIFGHTGIPNLIRLFKPHTSKIAFCHYGNWFFDDVQESRKKIKALQEDVELIPTHDGKELEV